MPNCASRGTKVCKERLPRWTCKTKPEDNFNIGCVGPAPMIAMAEMTLIKGSHNFEIK